MLESSLWCEYEICSGLSGAAQVVFALVISTLIYTEINFRRILIFFLYFFVMLLMLLLLLLLPLLPLLMLLLLLVLLLPLSLASQSGQVGTSSGWPPLAAAAWVGLID